MENYIKQNNKVFGQMIYDIIDSVPNTKWSDEQHKKDFKHITTADYIRFLYDLGFIEIDTFNKLYKQYQFMLKLTVLCDRYKKVGIECYEGKSEQLLDLLVDNMRDWIVNSLDLELKKQEKEHYIKNAFSKEENPHQLMANRTSQLKNEVQSILRKNR
jgi:hypothetical protein